MNIKDLIGKEAYEAIPEEKRKELDKKDFEDVSGGQYIPKERFDKVNQQSKDYKAQVGERDKQIESLKEEFKDAKGLKERVEELEAINKEQKEAYEKEVKDINFNYALKKALSDYKCKDLDYLMSKIDRDLIKLNDDGSIVGLKEQVEPFKKEHEYLFAQEPTGTGSFGTGNNPEGTQPTSKTEDIATTLGKLKAAETSGKGLADFIVK